MFFTWSQTMEALMGILKNEKISSTVLVLILVGAWWSYSWANDEFVNKGDFNKLTTLITTHVEDMQIVNASQLIRDKELAYRICEATGDTPGELKNLSDQIIQAKQYRNCLINKQPNCKHLKPPE
jgi:hypothetical protein